MLEVGDLVFMEEDKYEVAIYGIVIGFDSKHLAFNFILLIGSMDKHRQKARTIL